MDFVQPSVEFINELDNFKRIEIGGRTCYKSEARITDDSAFPFFQRAIKMGHTSILEHSVIYVRTHTPNTCLWLKNILNSYIELTGYQHYIRFSNWDDDETEYTPTFSGSDIPLGLCLGSEHLFSGNIRAWRKICECFKREPILQVLFSEHPAFKDIFEEIIYSDIFKEMKFFDDSFTKDDVEIVDSIPIDPKEFKYAYLHYPVTLRIVGDRGVIDEYARQRVCGISIESSRYCNYSKNGVTFVFPYWFSEKKDDPKFASFAGDFGNRCYETELAYQEWIKKCNIPQMARGNLTLWVKSEGVFTATIQQWIDILKLRDSPAAHPEAQKIAKMIEKVLVEEVGIEDLWGVKENG